MSPINPQYIAATVSEYVRAVIYILIWLITAVAALATSYIILRGIIVAVKIISQTIGI